MLNRRLRVTFLETSDQGVTGKYFGVLVTGSRFAAIFDVCAREDQGNSGYHQKLHKLYVAGWLSNIVRNKENLSNSMYLFRN